MQAVVVQSNRPSRWLHTAPVAARLRFGEAVQPSQAAPNRAMFVNRFFSPEEQGTLQHLVVDADRQVGVQNFFQYPFFMLGEVERAPDGKYHVVKDSFKMTAAGHHKTDLDAPTYQELAYTGALKSTFDKAKGIMESAFVRMIDLTQKHLKATFPQKFPIQGIIVTYPLKPKGNETYYGFHRDKIGELGIPLLANYTGITLLTDPQAFIGGDWRTRPYIGKGPNPDQGESWPIAKAGDSLILDNVKLEHAFGTLGITPGYQPPNNNRAIRGILAMRLLPPVDSVPAPKPDAT